MKVKLSAVCPVVQYGNLAPEVEVEADTYEEAFTLAESYITKFWNKYVEKGKELPDNSDRVLLRAYVGGEIYYDKLTHTYTNQNGDIYLSGSQYAESFRKPFDKEGIAQAMATKAGVKPEDIISMWELKSEASKDFGNAVHKALQLYETHRELAGHLEKMTHLHDNFVLKDIVQSFYELHKGEKALSELIVVDHKAKRAGQIDRLVLLGEKHGQVRDFKTGEVKDKLPIYFKQLEFYTGIMRADGWEMEQPAIDSWNGKWVTYDNK